MGLEGGPLMELRPEMVCRRNPFFRRLSGFSEADQLDSMGAVPHQRFFHLFLPVGWVALR